MKEELIYVVMYRPWSEQAGKYGEWANMGAFETREKAKATIKEMNEGRDWPALPNEYDSECLTFFRGK